jgi:tRNA nucleotidyltransferase (CCA-adding enzyme)
MADYIFLLETRLHPDQLGVVSYLQSVCRAAGYNLYLIGGPMRDLLAGQPIRTLDFCVEGNPLKIQKQILTGDVQLNYADEEEESLRLRMNGVRFRVSAARGASYDRPGKPPTVQAGTIREDMLRRGFTLDAIALSLNENSRGLLIDPSNGVADIEARLIRMIHNYVFLEDPVRLLRAVRLRARLGFEIEERTLARMQAARDENYLENASRSSLGRELEAIAYEPDPVPVVKALEKENLLEPAFGKGVRVGHMDLGALSRIPKTVEQLEEAGIAADSAPLVLEFLLGDLPDKDRSRFTRLAMSKPLLAAWQRLHDDANHLSKTILGRGGNSLSAMHDLLHGIPGHVVLYLLMTSNQPRVQKKLKDFITAIPELKKRLPIRQLQLMGSDPNSPVFQRVIESVYRQLLEGKLQTDEQIQQTLKTEADRLHAIPPPAPKPEPEVMPSRRGKGRRKGQSIQAAPAVGAAPAAGGPTAKAGSGGEAGGDGAAQKTPGTVATKAPGNVEPKARSGREAATTKPASRTLGEKPAKSAAAAAKDRELPSARGEKPQPPEAKGWIPVGPEHKEHRKSPSKDADSAPSHASSAAVKDGPGAAKRKAVKPKLSKPKAAKRRASKPAKQKPAKAKTSKRKSAKPKTGKPSKAAGKGKVKPSRAR